MRITPTIALIALTSLSCASSFSFNPIKSSKTKFHSTSPHTQSTQITPLTPLTPLTSVPRGGAIMLPSVLTSPSLSLKSLTVLSFLTTSIGLNRFYYFFSLGYGLSMAALAGGTLLLTPGGTFLSKAHVGGFVFYGVRLFGFLLSRNQSVPEKKAQVDEMETKTTLKAKLSFWPFAALLYPLMFSPALFHHLAATATSATPSIFAPLLGVFFRPIPITQFGLGIFFFGLAVEALADYQKSAAKKLSNTFVSSGVWSYSRHANYAGEILVYLGSLIAAIPHFKSWTAFGLSLFGTAGILNTMFGATNRLDKKQTEKYGDAEYKAYVGNSKKLFF